ncbi:AzlD domain-containing protein [Deinococcus alpinitundrae]|uniref:AzlD domain-containing protein n=1 Tax=Deinococcus alpinitundrae TaxID=468913 RepID=UPI00235366F2|nr:AzlD domain-containing protein [Deinococcus alpinitundrae]
MSTALPVLLTLLGMWAVTYAARLSGLSLGHLRLSAFWLAFLRFVPISVFAALIVPDVVNSADWPRQLLACAVATLLLWRTRSLAWGIVGGFTVYWLLRQVS